MTTATTLRPTTVADLPALQRQGLGQRLAADGMARRVVCTGMLGEARYWGP